MVRIGIISPLHKENIRRCIKRIIPRCAAVSGSAGDDILCALADSGVKNCVIDLEKNSCYVDILIFDTCDRSLASKALRSISSDTRLLYSSDCCPPIIHPYAISYGFSQESTVTVSSFIGDYLILSVVRNKYSHSVCGCVNEMLCASACGTLCGISE